VNLPEIYEDRGRMPQVIRDEAPFFQPVDDQITFSYLFAMLRRRLPVLILTTVAALTLGLLWTLSTPQIFNASADVVLLTNQSDLVPGGSTDEAQSVLRDEDVQTQIQLISSRAMASQVFDALELENDADFRLDIVQPRTTLDNIMTGIGLRRQVEAPQITDAGQFRERAVGFLQRALTVSRVGSSFNLHFDVQDSDAGRAALIANTYARLYTTDDARQRAVRNETAAQVLGERLAELRAQANSDFAQVQGYRVRNDLLSSAATSLTEQEISTYNQQIASARSEAAQDGEALASARAQLARGGAGNVGQGTSSSVVSALRAQRSQLSVQEADLARRYLERHPELITVREQIANIDSQINAEVGREIRALEAQAASSAQRLNSLLASRSGTRSQLRGDNSALVQLADLERQAEASQALYQSYLQRFNEIMAGTGAEQPNARLISLAEVSRFPTQPNWALMMGLSLVIGLLIGTLLAILLEIAYRGLTTLEDVESRLSVNALSSVPAYRSIKPFGADPVTTLQEYPDGPFAESMRSVLISIGRNSSGRCEVIAISSSIPGEGKTTLAACLGRTIANANQSVVVVDCDVIRSQLSRMFELDNGENGLHEALADPNGTLPHYRDGESQLHILPITRPFRKGERLTENGKLQRVVTSLREQFDFVILDCPPILPIAEAREIVALADSVVLVVRWRNTLDKIVKSAIRQLSPRVLARTGVVLNMVDMRKQVRFGGNDSASFYKYYQSYYG